MPADAIDPFGVYVHVPFCASKCDYCAFATWTDRHHLTDAYLDALRTDIAAAVDAGMPRATSCWRKPRCALWDACAKPIP